MTTHYEREHPDCAWHHAMTPTQPEPTKVDLWNAINAYAQACRGDTSNRTATPARMKAVVDIELILAALNRDGKDTERLDWLEKNPGSVLQIFVSEPIRIAWVIGEYPYPPDRTFPTLRAAIDAAISQTTKGGDAQCAMNSQPEVAVLAETRDAVTPRGSSDGAPQGPTPSAAPATPVLSEADKASIRRDHAATAAHNEGMLGMPQGPCQCEICQEPPPATQLPPWPTPETVGCHAIGPDPNSKGGGPVFGPKHATPMCDLDDQLIFSDQKPDPAGPTHSEDCIIHTQDPNGACNCGATQRELAAKDTEIARLTAEKINLGNERNEALEKCQRLTKERDAKDAEAKQARASRHAQEKLAKEAFEKWKADLARLTAERDNWQARMSDEETEKNQLAFALKRVTKERDEARGAYEEAAKEIFDCPHCQQLATLREVLKEAGAVFEEIRLLLIKDLDEPQRSAFWKAVKFRDRIAALALSAEGAR